MCKGIVELVITTIRTKSKAEEAVDEKQIDDLIRRVSSVLAYELSEEEFEAVRKELHHRQTIVMEPGIAISSDPNFKNWYNPIDIDPSYSYWERYKKYLSSDLLLPEKVIQSIDISTTDIVNLLGEPVENGIFARKGLVIGDVQSGKTANYISVINKAADAGYKVIVLLTGTIEKLRQQTQARIDEGFIGIDTSDLERERRNNPIGVGLINGGISVSSFTSIIKDFNKSVLTNSNVPLDSLSIPLILVVKKNKAVLNSIYKLFNGEKKDQTYNKINQSLLFIDDEADNASINTNSQDNDPTAINKSIRRILGLFMRSSYVGYTATPYANVFIEPSTKEDMENEDLFPKDYIYVLQPPSNYIGAREIYSEDGQYKSMYRMIDDFEDFLPLKHKKDYQLPLDIPLTLKKAILSFFIANAIRDLRGDLTTHRSMLINVSRFICIQNDLKDLVNDYFLSVRDKIQHYLLNSDYSKYPVLSLLEDIYNEEFKNVSSFKETKDINWESIREQLFNSIKNIRVESINGGNASKLLDYKGYDNGLRLIAIGGLSLSRGLTLEGLCISYFYRNSIMYDTLMQMGRWFGYRRNYEDLCQVWMSEESYSWYQHISDATDELRDEINRIYYSNLKPLDVGIKVRSSEGALIVTAKNKMRSAGDYIADLALDGDYIEAPYFSRSSQIINGNIEAVKNLLNVLQSNEYTVVDPEELSLENKSAKQILDVKKEIIVEFLKQVDTHHRNIKFIAPQVAELIESSSEELLDTWDIAFAKGKSRNKFDIFGEKINRVERSLENTTSSIITLRKHRIGSLGMATCGLTEAQCTQIEELIKKNNKNNKKPSGKRVADKEYFKTNFKRKPLLVIYLIDVKSSENITHNQPLVGLGIGIPKLKESRGLNYKYKVNTTWLKENYDEDEFEVDDTGEYDD